MKSRTRVSALTLMALAIGLAGCSAIQAIDDTVARVDQSAKKTEDLMGSMKKNAKEQRGPVLFTNKPWVNTRPMATKKGLPVARDCELEYNESKTLQQFAQWISETCDIPVRITPDALDGGASYTKVKTATKPVGPVPIHTAGESLADLFPGGSTTAVSAGSYGSARFSHPVRYSGRLSGLLESLTGSMGLSWKYDPVFNGIKIFYLDTRHFPVYAFNNSTKFKSEVSSGMSSSAGTSGSGGGGGEDSGVSGDSGSDQSTLVEMSSKLTEDIEKNIRSMLSLNQMSFSKATGVITITDRPEVLDRVQAYLDTENESITKQILINVEVISVSLTDKDQLAIDWDLVYKSADWEFGLANTFPGISGGGSSSIGIIDTANSPWAGSKAIIQALSEQGRVSSHKAPSVTTLNLQAAPVQIGKVKGYLASSQTTQSANVGSSTALMPGSITSGFNMSLVPMVLPEKQLLMQLAINMSGDPTFETIESGDSMIQNPSYDLQIFNQSVKLRSGQTLVLSGFDQTTEKAALSGLGDARNFWMGGGRSRDTSRDMVVVLITPIIME